MKDKDELKELLDRLKGEVGGLSVTGAPVADEIQRVRPGAEAAPAPASLSAVPRPARPERPLPGRSDFQRAERPGAGGTENYVWSENKEILLLGMLASLLAVFGGVLAGLEYVILIGAVVFMLFSFLTVLALFWFYLDFRAKRPDAGSLAEKVDQLSRRLEALSARAAHDTPPGRAEARSADGELERKVAELRTVVKALARTMDRQEDAKP